MRVDGSTRICGIIGDPVAHSLSPAMHNAAFTNLNLNYVYVPLPTSHVETAINGLKALHNIRGISVTIPHKQAVISCLDEIDPVAKKIGAVNTLVFNNQQISGLNTDWMGAIWALEEELALPGKKILLLGAGGSAKAIGFGLIEKDANVTIASRTPETGRKLASLLGCDWIPLADAASVEADGLVNATSVGMKPLAEESPIESGALKNFGVVMDIVYAPLKTKLLYEAQKSGCRVIDGLAMLLYQGAAQFELWTGQKAPLAAMRQALLGTLAT